MKQKNKFPLVGLSAGNRCTLRPDETDKDWFHAPTNLTPDRFQALFDYFKKGPDDIWKDKPYAMVEHDGLFESGIPKNPVVTEVML
jgi:hypothetical protein